MGLLTLVGSLALLAALVDCLRSRRIDWFWLSITAGATLFWGSVFVQSLG